MYGIFDVALDSDIPLPELLEVETADTVISVSAGEDTNIIPDQLEWFHHWETPKGEVCISCARLADSYVLRFPESGDFVVSLSGTSVQYFPASNIPVETIRHLLLDQIIPRILGQLGRLVVHASAVVLPNGKTVAFLGNSGHGKSTIAAYFCQNGAQLLTDDCLLIENQESGVTAIPNYYGLRLFEDSIEEIFGQKHEFFNVAHYSNKKRLYPDYEKAIKLSSAKKMDAIFFLGRPGNNTPSNDVIIEPIRGTKELMVLIEQMFVLDVTDMDLIARQFQNLGEIISTELPIYRLEFPRKHSLLPVVKTRVNNVLK